MDAAAQRRRRVERPLWAVLAGQPCRLDFHRFRDRKGVLKLDTEISDSAVHLRMAQQKLDRAQVAGLPVDLRDLGPSHRMGSVGTRLEADGRHPVANEPGVLACRNVQPLVEAPRPEVLRPDHRRVVQPCRDGLAGPLGDLETNRVPGLGLDDRGALLDLTCCEDIRDLQAYEVTAAQLAVDCEVEQREVPDAVRDLEAHPNSPDVFRQERTFLADETALVPGAPFGADGGKVCSRHGASSAPPHPPRRRHHVDNAIIPRERRPNGGLEPKLTSAGEVEFAGAATSVTGPEPPFEVARC